MACCQSACSASISFLNTLRPRQNGHHFADDIFKCIFLNENIWILIKISLKFVPKSPINNIPALVQIMAWRRSGDKPLSEPIMIGLPMHICFTRPQWVNQICHCQCSMSSSIHNCDYYPLGHIYASFGLSELKIGRQDSSPNNGCQGDI